MTVPHPSGEGVNQNGRDLPEWLDDVLRRLMDIGGALLGLFLTAPVMAAVGLWVKLDSPGKMLYRQERIGRDGKPFFIFKFRTMVEKADRKGTLITIGNRDPRITRAGYWLRKLKFDEFPQLLNVLFGQMSFVGPRPEVRRYVELYSPRQREVLKARPGITDPASIVYRHENEILAGKPDPEAYYRRVIMPRKLRLNLSYLESRNVCTDVKMIVKTLGRIL